jgi:hypothetical protein
MFRCGDDGLMKVLVDFDNYCWVDLVGCMPTWSSISVYANLPRCSCPPIPKFKKDTRSPIVGNYHVNGQLKQHVVDRQLTGHVVKGKDHLDVVVGKFFIEEANKLLMKKDIRKELKLADDHIEVEEEVGRIEDNNKYEDFFTHSNEDHNVVEPTTNMALEGNIMETHKSLNH